MKILLAVCMNAFGESYFQKQKTNAGQREAWKIHKHNIVYSRLENLFHKWVNGVRAMIVENNSREIKATEDAPGVYLFLLSVSFIFFFLLFPRPL